MALAGCGILALALVKYGGARHVTGLDIEADNISCALYNASRLRADRGHGVVTTTNHQGEEQAEGRRNGSSPSSSSSPHAVSLADRLAFFEADSFDAKTRDGTAHMDRIRRRPSRRLGGAEDGTEADGRVDFLVSNPPADFGTPLEDDGFGCVRACVLGGMPALRASVCVFAKCRGDPY
jgi:hypothetical protein